MFEREVDKGRGNPVGRVDAERSASGIFTSIPNPIRDTGESDEDPPVIPIREAPKRDRSREPQAGTSVGYAVRRLGRERPDLLAVVPPLFPNGPHCFFTVSQWDKPPGAAAGGGLLSP